MPLHTFTRACTMMASIDSLCMLRTRGDVYRLVARGHQQQNGLYDELLKRDLAAIFWPPRL
ncbi:MAG TPA: hypothetical protein EYQ84_08410 [Nitrospinaceae bacterium]|nr:hypothetical protein [Nitrospinaceae bacterium]